MNLLVCSFLLTFISIPSTCSYKILVYSPSFAGSHMNFLAHVADALSQAGNDVTYFVPVVDETRKKSFTIKHTKDVIVVERDEEMINQAKPVAGNLDALWTSHLDHTNIATANVWFNEIMALSCDNLFRNKLIIEELKKREYDVAIIEPINVCGLGLFKKLGIEKTILASSVSFFDFVLPFIGEPSELSYVPSFFSVSGEDMDIFERYANYRVAAECTRTFVEHFDREMAIYRKHLGDDLPHWKQLLADASINFVNSNPHMEFPRPMLSKSIQIGGISVDIEYIKSQKLSKEWDEIVGKRSKTVLISFGSMIQSQYMPIKWRNGLLNAIRSRPNVTFIWKYENDNIEWAQGIDNLHFSKWVPQTALLGDARLSAFITHGGLGSTNELAFTGKPAIMIPIFADQYRNSLMLARQNGVIVFDKNQLENPEKVVGAIDSILFDEKYSKNARRLAALLARQPLKPKEQLVKFTEFVAEFGPFPEMNSQRRHLNYFVESFLDIYVIFAVAFLIVFSVILLVSCLVYRRIISIFCHWKLE